MKLVVPGTLQLFTIVTKSANIHIAKKEKCKDGSVIYE